MTRDELIAKWEPRIEDNTPNNPQEFLQDIQDSYTYIARAIYELQTLVGSSMYWTKRYLLKNIPTPNNEDMWVLWRALQDDLFL